MNPNDPDDDDRDRSRDRDRLRNSRDRDDDDDMYERGRGRGRGRDDDYDDRPRRRDDDYDDFPRRRRGGGGYESSDLSAGEWLVAILCSGIGCIVGIVYLCQGNPKGGKMFGISLLFVIIWNVISFAITGGKGFQNL